MTKISFTNNSLDQVLSGLDKNVTGDFLAMDNRQALHYLAEITTDDLLDNTSSASFVLECNKL